MSLYDKFVEQARVIASQGGLSPGDRSHLTKTLSPVNEFFQELKQAGLVAEVVHGDIESGITCSAKVDENYWVVAHCCLPIINNRSTIRWGTSVEKRTIEDKNGEEWFYVPETARDPVGLEPLLSSLAELVGEANKVKLASQRAIIAVYIARQNVSPGIR
jgi:hypothetical protein